MQQAISLAAIPGYAEDTAGVRDLLKRWRADNAAGARTTDVAGFALRDLRTSDLGPLIAAGNRYLCGGVPDGGDAADLIWLLSRWHRPCAGPRAWLGLFLRSIVRARLRRKLRPRLWRPLRAGRWARIAARYARRGGILRGYARFLRLVDIGTAFRVLADYGRGQREVIGGLSRYFDRQFLDAPGPSDAEQPTKPDAIGANAPDPAVDLYVSAARLLTMSREQVDATPIPMLLALLRVAREHAMAEAGAEAATSAPSPVAGIECDYMVLFNRLTKSEATIDDCARARALGLYVPSAICGDRARKGERLAIAAREELPAHG